MSLPLVAESRAAAVALVAAGAVGSTRVDVQVTLTRTGSRIRGRTCRKATVSCLLVVSEVDATHMTDEPCDLRRGLSESRTLRVATRSGTSARPAKL